MLKHGHKVRLHIETNLHLKLPAKDLAKVAGLSRTYFYKQFLDHFGKPVRYYVLEQRMNRAKFLLSTTHLSITEIGYAVGYNQHSAFSAAFRRAVGQPPLAFRRRAARSAVSNEEVLAKTY